jgi:hydroxyacylglutathione hydrolase
MIIKRLEVSAFASNCYIVSSENHKDAILIDPGDEGKRILKTIKDIGVDVKVIVLTHSHFDHIGALKEVKDATNAEIAIHTADAGPLTLRMPYNLAYPMPPHTPPADRQLNDGDIIAAGDLSFTVIHTPGHTPGGICLYGHKVLFTGDTLFQGSIGRSDFPGGNSNQLLQSIVKKLMTLPEDTVVYPGHGPATTIGRELRSNPFIQELL